MHGTVTQPRRKATAGAWLDRGLFLDIEMAGKGITKLGAVWGNKVFHGGTAGEIRRLLTELNRAAEAAAFVGGHHLIAHDLPHLRAAFGSAASGILARPVVDSLILSTLTFPENPYHALVKDHKLVVASRNRPVEDARLSRTVVADCLRKAADEDGLLLDGLVVALHAMQHSALPAGARAGIAQWAEAAGLASPGEPEVRRRWLGFGPSHACPAALRAVWMEAATTPDTAHALAHVAAWLPVAGAESILPGWVRHAVPATASLAHRLRATPCGDSSCAYCRQHHDPQVLVKRYFGYDDFRPKPELPGQPGASLQAELVRRGLAGEPVLGILPTGGGKSLCFQLPALAHHERTGALTVVISPLQALMQDQVEGLATLTKRRRAAAITGLLTPLERKEALERVRLGNTGILYISPEQLRSRSLLRAVEARQIAAWVFDEAHCLAKWGHDFRPDYLYAAKYIARRARERHESPPPVFAFTATAKAEVRDEIVEHLRDRLGQQTAVLDAGAERANLDYRVETASPRERPQRIIDLLASRLDGNPGTGCVFARTRADAKELAATLAEAQPAWGVRFFHAGLTKEEKKAVLADFLEGPCRVVVATNAFGMGIDKDNIRIVIHASIPSSLENYLQEAGRAGRDGHPAECVLIYTDDDLEAQFRLLGRTELEPREIQTVWRAIQRAERDGREEIVLTTREIRDSAADFGEDLDDGNPNADGLTTRIRTAIATLEDRGFLERTENVTRALSAQPLVSDLAEARARIARLDVGEPTASRWLAILGTLLTLEEGANPLDALCQLQPIENERERAKERGEEWSSGEAIVFRNVHQMAEPRVALVKIETRIGVRFDVAGAHPVHKRLAVARHYEESLRKLLEESAPDAEGTMPYVLRHINQGLLDRGIASTTDQITRVFSTWELDSKRYRSGGRPFCICAANKECGSIQLPGGWQPLRELQERRLNLAARVVEFLTSRAKEGERESGSASVKLAFALEDLEADVRADLTLRSEAGPELSEKVRHALCYLHEHHILELRDGKALITQSMTLRILDPRTAGQRRRQFQKGDFEALRVHYSERRFQIHVMEEYARLGLERLTSHLALIKAYFELGREAFVKTFVRGGAKLMEMATSFASHEKIYGTLKNPDQQSIVAAHEARSMLVLAGPGSGKTRTLVHRCAWLLRARRIRPERILMVCFNRHAAIELRRRLWDLAGADAAGVMIQTYHGLALRLLGRSFAPNGDGRAAPTEKEFRAILKEAAERIDGSTDAESDTDAATGELRQRIRAGFTHLLVDEYQDIDQDEYRFLSALAAKGCTEDKRPVLLAVGDDDQAIYGFKGARVAFIRRFEEEFNAKSHSLLQNYRSSAAIIEAANQLIVQNRDRLKTGHPIRPDRARRHAPPGGRWTTIDPVAQGRVQVLAVADAVHEAAAIRAELKRLRSLDPAGSWSDFAVLGRRHEDLWATRALLEAADIPVAWRGEHVAVPVFRVREVVRWLAHLDAHAGAAWTAAQLRREFQNLAAECPGNPWWSLLESLVDEWATEEPKSALPVAAMRHFMAEALADRKRGAALQPGVALSTVHAAKGLEFGHVLVGGGGWSPMRVAEEEEQRRTYYVAMTRAKENLILLNRGDSPLPYLRDLRGIDYVPRPGVNPMPPDVVHASRRYERLGPDMLVISWAGTRPDNSTSARAIRRLVPGATLEWQANDHGIYLAAGSTRVAKLSAKAAATWRPRLAQIRATRVAALIERRADDDSSPSALPITRPTWEYPVVDVEWEAR